MLKAARELLDVLQTCARDGHHPVRDVIPASERFTMAEHYPRGDVEDIGTGCAWYYHAHDPVYAQAWQEHGHFHCFMYTEQLGRAARPMAQPAQPDVQKGGLLHLAAIDFDANGTPTRIFIPNRWVTDEWLYPARATIALIDRFNIVSDQRYAMTNRFLAALLRLYHPHIASALHGRDRVVWARGKHGVQGITEDRAIPVIASIAINLDADLAALDRAWKT